MAVPVALIAGATIGAGLGLFSGISNYQNAKLQARLYNAQSKLTQAKRTKEANQLVQQQAVTFLHNGVYFEGTPELVMQETYKTAETDNSIVNNNNIITVNNLMNQAKLQMVTNVLGSTLQGASLGLGFNSLSGGLSPAKPKVVGNTSGNSGIPGLNATEGTVV